MIDNTLPTFTVHDGVLDYDACAMWNTDIGPCPCYTCGVVCDGTIGDVADKIICPSMNVIVDNDVALPNGESDA